MNRRSSADPTAVSERIRMSSISISSRVADLVVERPARARVFEELRIDYCCGGGQSLGEACRSRGLDAETVVAVLRAAEAGADPSETNWSDAGLGALCDHIVEAHHGYLRRELPRLAELLEKVERAHADERPELRELRATFERLRAELVAHTEAEEESLFPAVRRIEAGASPDAALERELAGFEEEHAAAGALLEELARVTGGHDLSRALCNTHRAALDGLRELERDLHEHIHEENNLLFPRLLAELDRAA
jgi:regulator of cell morphogenesis and NO signaling